MNPPPTSAVPRGFSCLLLDDDQDFSGMLAKLVREAGGEPHARPSVAAARDLIQSRSFDMAVLDNCLPDGTGYEFYADLRRRCPQTVTMMITGAPELAQAVELTRNGLFDYLTKPVNADDFLASLRRARLRLSSPDAPADFELAGNSAAMRDVLQHLHQAARYPEATVLLLGETGTGKDLAARALHRFTHGDHADSTPYVAVNCSAVPSEMFESELFGSERGAYTGADRKRAGFVEAAGNGTLFLDEVAEIPLPLQSKLLRFLENREYRVLGSTAVRKFSGRVVAATNRPLADEVRAGRFREDLLYRLDVMSVSLPPLRERPDDIPALAETILSQLVRKYGRRKPYLRAEDLAALAHHHFPGNARELRNLLERSLLKSSDDAPWLPLDLSWLKPTASSAERGMRNAESVAAGIGSAFASEAAPTPDRELTPLEAQEYQMIARVLREEGGGIRRAAAKLGLTHQALLRRLQKWPELRQAVGG